jgi:hypothetical protein
LKNCGCLSKNNNHPLLQNFLDADLEEKWIKQEIYNKKIIMYLTIAITLLTNAIFDISLITNLIWIDEN